MCPAERGIPAVVITLALGGSHRGTLEAKGDGWGGNITFVLRKAE